MLTMDECCKLVLAECPNTWAHSYASAWLNEVVAARAHAYNIPLEEAKRTQCIYILSNIESWRGENAKKVRQSLKHIAGVDKIR